MSILTDDEQPNELVPDPVTAKELNVSLMTLWRWDRDPEMIAMGWPPCTQIRRRNYRGRKQLEEFKAAALRRAISTRNKEMAA